MTNDPALGLQRILALMTEHRLLVTGAHVTGPTGRDASAVDRYLRRVRYCAAREIRYLRNTYGMTSPSSTMFISIVT